MAIFKICLQSCQLNAKSLEYPAHSDTEADLNIPDKQQQNRRLNIHRSTGYTNTLRWQTKPRYLPSNQENNQTKSIIRVESKK